MMKKIAALIGAGAMLLSVAGPAFGAWNYADVNNTSSAVSNTGANSQNNYASVTYSGLSAANAGSMGTRSIVTGDACSDSTAVTVANTNVASGGFATMNTAHVDNGSYAESWTGSNSQNDSASTYMTVGALANSGSTDARTIRTGDAWSDSTAVTVANTNALGGSLFTANMASVNNSSQAVSNTGGNQQNNSAGVTNGVWSAANAGSTGSRTASTGYAGSNADSWTVVNSNVAWH